MSDSGMSATPSLGRPALTTAATASLRKSVQSRTYSSPWRDRHGEPSDVTDASTWSPRNVLHGPAVWTYDFSLSKRVPFGGTRSLSVEANIFNLFNRTNLDLPQGNLSSALFGRITRTAAGFGPRQMQFGAKLTF